MAFSNQISLLICPSAAVLHNTFMGLSVQILRKWKTFYFSHKNHPLCFTDKPVHDPNDERAPYKMIQTIGLCVGAAVAYIIIVLGLMFYCKKRRKAKRLQKGQDGEEPELECLNGMSVGNQWVLTKHSHPQ